MPSRIASTRRAEELTSVAKLSGRKSANAANLIAKKIAFKRHAGFEDNPGFSIAIEQFSRPKVP